MHYKIYEAHGVEDMFRYRNRETADRIAAKLKGMELNIRLMHVCGTHQDTIVHFGLDSIFKECGVEMRQGPGCPVCVTPTREYEEVITLARKGHVVASFGDASRVMGLKSSLIDLRAEGHDVRIVYGIEDAVKIAKQTDRSVVFMAVGFETTAPSTATTILSGPPENFTVLSCHRYMPPALDALLGLGEVRLQGLMEPGHVSTIIGVEPYEILSQKYRLPQVVAGFEPLDVLMAVYMLAQQVERGEAKVENEYTRVVKNRGNPKALEAMEKVFEPADVEWRGFNIIPRSGTQLRKKFQRYDARKVFEDELKSIEEQTFKQPEGCRCGDILRGVADAEECKLFGLVCTPEHAVGPCMVSAEGLCNIAYKYGQRKR